MSKQELAMDYFKKGYNCAQAVLLAFHEDLGLDEKTAINIAGPFGGGIGRSRETCGAACGMLMAVGMIEENDTSCPEHKKAMYDKARTLLKAFEAENGAVICRTLLALQKGEDTGTTPEPRTEGYYKKRPCVEIVGGAARIAQNAMKQSGKEV